MHLAQQTTLSFHTVGRPAPGLPVELVAADNSRKVIATIQQESHSIDGKTRARILQASGESRWVGVSHLVDCWADAAERQHLLQLLDGEVGHSNVLHQSLEHKLSTQNSCHNQYATQMLQETCHLHWKSQGGKGEKSFSSRQLLSFRYAFPNGRCQRAHMQYARAF